MQNREGWCTLPSVHHTTWRPSGIIDVVIERRPVSDPEASLYDDTRWILVKEAPALRLHEGWDDNTIAVVCVEAVRELPSHWEWRTASRYVMYVNREDVIDYPEGTVASNDRYVLRDLAWKCQQQMRV